MTFDDFRQDAIALLTCAHMTDEEIIDSLIYNCVVAKEKIMRNEYALLQEVAKVGLTD